MKVFSFSETTPTTPNLGTTIGTTFSTNNYLSINGSKASISLSPDGAYLAMVIDESTKLAIVVWSVSSNGSLTEKSRVSTNDTPSAIAWERSSQYFVAASFPGNSLQMYSFASGTPIAIGSKVTTESNPRSISWGPNNNYIAVANYGSNSLQIFTVNYVIPEIDVAIALNVSTATDAILASTLTTLNNAFFAGNYRVNECATQKNTITTEQSNRAKVISAIKRTISSSTPDTQLTVALALLNGTAPYNATTYLEILNTAGTYTTSVVSTQKTAITNEQSRRTTIDAAIALVVATATDIELTNELATLNATGTYRAANAATQVTAITAEQALRAAITVADNSPKIPLNLAPGFIAETGAALAITVGSKNTELEAWCIALDGSLWRYDNYSSKQLAWVKQASIDTQGNVLLFKDISATADGHLVGLSKDGVAYNYNRTKTNWNKINPGIENTALILDNISAGNTNTIWAVSEAEETIYQLASTGWVAQAQSGIAIAASFDGTVVSIDPEGVAFKYDSGRWIAMPGVLLESIAVGDKNNIFGITSDNKLWQYTENHWITVIGNDGLPASGLDKIALNAVATTFALDTEGNIYRKGNAGVGVVKPQQTDLSKSLSYTIKQLLSIVTPIAPDVQKSRDTAIKKGTVKSPPIKKTVKKKKKVIKKKTVKKIIKKTPVKKIPVVMVPVKKIPLKKSTVKKAPVKKVTKNVSLKKVALKKVPIKKIAKVRVPVKRK